VVDDCCSGNHQLVRRVNRRANRPLARLVLEGEGDTGYRHVVIVHANGQREIVCEEITP
jgi:hypothetical protein